MTSPIQEAQAWLDRFAAALVQRDAHAAAALFVEHCYWRDLLTFTWNIKTLEGQAAVHDMLEATLQHVQPSGWAITGEPTRDERGTEAWFQLETAVARAEGVVRLIGGKCHTMFTAMKELKGHEEPRGPTRPAGTRHRADPNRVTWTDARRHEEETLGEAVQPYVVVVGGGQCGMALGARLKQLGVSTIILDKNARPGDAWRQRYRTLVLHDPIWFDHLPYLPFPEHWPVFTPKDKLGDWMEMYAKVMELNYWTHATCTHATYDEQAKEWTVEVDREGQKRVLKPKHLVFATGNSGPPRMVQLPGQEDFKGQVLHSSQYSDGKQYQGKKVAVIGAGSSGHDVCVDLWESGADVTMVQRHPTTVVRIDTLLKFGMQLYSEGAVAAGITADKADMILASLPYRVLEQVLRQMTDQIRAHDADFYRRLEAAGFLLDFGEDDTGLTMKAFRTASGYYIDVGCSDLIINGDVRVKSGADIERLTADGILFKDGTHLQADAIVACTGFKTMGDVIARVVSDEVVQALGPCSGLGSGVRGDPGPWAGEIRNMWKPTRQEGLWIMSGNLAYSRFYSRFLALQLKARKEGLPTPVYGEADGVHA
ncbi:MAG: NAD(P)/FAD-dependent oxidoreductase [Sphaerotilus natans subsp. sulfidivorans]|uniref:flavin-containing monooxygenase n=1 Tax=Sphaerotilus sulfidivorans TaxID=639200 RepID=UPI002354CE40|nr:NAD(P)/FAD-dependent oxidoreductase [Sphaerotilus sulfidivorans]MCK6401329.1 NAD(P)/FAD-dependent oxidoreductase [Sphaerotilus sulfidivorans]